jgi:DNA-binding transcriptional MerR regulator
MKPIRKSYTIQQVSEKLGIPRPTLRFWEKEFKGIIRPIRTNGGQRRYTVEQIVIIEKIQTLKKNGMRLAEIKDQFDSDPSIRINRSDSEKVQFIAEKIATLVKEEVYQFLSNGRV